MEDTYIMRTYKKALKLPFGARLFSAYAARKAPYFRTVHPLVTHLEPNHCEIFIKKRRAVENHIGTMHVIAIANGLEMAMGFLAEASIPKNLRWIPKGMDLAYPAKADSGLTCVATVDPAAWKPGDLEVKVVARKSDGTEVVTGTIHLWISEKPAR
jgi:hypothetical protein